MRLWARARLMTALAVFFLAIAVVVTSARADGVGFRDISIEVDGERLITALWYPTDAPSETDDRRPLQHGGEPGSADRCGSLRPHRDFARDRRRPPEPPRYGDPSGRRRLCRRGPRTCRRQLSRQEIQRHIGELAPSPPAPARDRRRPPEPAERGSGSAPRRRPISARTSTPGVSVPSGTQPAATACLP